MNQHEKLSKFFRTFKGEEAGRKFVFLLMGRSGVGKSSAINTLLGEDIVPVGDYEPTTMEIGFYDADLNGNPCQVIDTPGLCDELEGVGNDQKYLDRIRSQIKQFDLMWFVSCLNDTRVQLGDKRGIKLISEALGSKIWEHSLIVLTFANNIDSPEERYGETLQKRTELLRKEIAKYTGTSIADSIPVVAVDNKKETTPDGEKWLGELYSEVLLRMAGDARAPYIMATLDDVESGRIPLNEKQGAKIKKLLDKVREPFNDFAGDLDKDIQDVSEGKVAVASAIPGTFAGLRIGAGFGRFGGPIGMAIGGVVGTLIGLVVLDLYKKHNPQKSRT